MNICIAQNLGVVTYLAVAGAIFQNIGVQKLQAALPDASEAEVLELTTGTNSAFYRSLNQDQQRDVIDQVTLAIRNVFALMMVGSALGLILSGFLGVSSLSECKYIWFIVTDSASLCSAVSHSSKEGHRKGPV